LYLNLEILSSNSTNFYMPLCVPANVAQSRIRLILNKHLALGGIAVDAFSSAGFMAVDSVFGAASVRFLGALPFGRSS